MRKNFGLLVLSAIALTLPAAGTRANTGDFTGGVAIGSGYAGVNTAPTNGLIVQGNVGIGTTSPIGGTALNVNGAFDANSLMLNGLQVPLAPGGRLTLSSSNSVMTADATGVSTVYYLPHAGQNVPVYDGTNWVEQDIGTSGLALTLSTTNMPTSEVFDVYASMQSGNLTLCSLYWGGNTARSSTAGGKSGTQDARISQLNGFWVNKTAIATNNCYNGATAYPIAVNQGTLLGSFHTSANGQTEWICHPAPASGGGSVDVAISNVYNGVPVSCTNVDNGALYAYTVATARVWRNSTANEDHWLDTLGNRSVSIAENALAEVSTNSAALIGTGLNSTTTASGVNSATTYTSAATSNFMTLAVNNSFLPQLGYNYLAPLEGSVAVGTTNWNPSGSSVGGFNPTQYAGSTISIGAY